MGIVGQNRGLFWKKNLVFSLNNLKWSVVIYILLQNLCLLKPGSEVTCQNTFDQSDCRILQGSISQEESERPSRFFVCKLTPKLPTRKYYCVDMGDQASLKYLKQQVYNILVIETDVFYCIISQGCTCSCRKT